MDYEKLEYFVLPEPMSGCWLWTGRTHQFGYGVVSHKGRDRFVHRFFFEYYRGPIPIGLSVLHTCDNPYCVNPDHLYVGTQADNMRDVKLRKRAIGKHDHRGENHPSNKLTWKDVAAIRKSRLPYRKLAKNYGVCLATIGHIKSGRNWKEAQYELF